MYKLSSIKIYLYHISPNESGVINNPAMLAVMKQMIDPATNPRNATSTMTDFFSGHIALSAPIITPTELGLANPQIAYVAIAELRS